ncbi:MAG TPA: LysM peptidoglycan-binding domain-containing protein, partial [Chloroflexia bacterium]|nr:LysM peptidoglycan-binding domain-containing protein [Chloroflexia bacterium]
APVADGPNLLDNPGFESPYVKQCCQTDLSIYLPGTPIAEVQVAHGWSGWWLQPDQDAQHPSAGGHPSWHRPEWREANCGSVCANRIHSGNNAQKYFTFYSVHDSGMFQQVSHGITPGTNLRFSVYMQGWSTNADYGLSDFNQNMGMRIGIDPFGGTNPFSADVIWTPANDTFDRYALYVLEATARSSTVTVFTRSTPGAGNQHNDSYVDDASLVAVSGGGNNGGNDGGGNDNNPPPPPPPTPTEITGLRYVVMRGDNYYRIARRFGVSLSLLYLANHVINPNILYTGTVLIIPGVTGPVEEGGGGDGNPAPQPTAVPQPTVAPQDLPGAFSYVVVRGDNLFRLSLRFGVSIARIKQLNNLVSDIIYLGQTLIIAP